MKISNRSFTYRSPCPLEISHLWVGVVHGSLQCRASLYPSPFLGWFRKNSRHLWRGYLLILLLSWRWVVKSKLCLKNHWIVDEPRVCYTQWSKSEREKQILYIKAYMWNLEKRYWWTYFHRRNREANVENGLVDTLEKGEGGTKWESSIEIYTLPYVK